MPEISQSTLQHSADVVVRSALKLGAKERFVVVCDGESLEIGEALAAAAQRSDALVTLARLDQLRSISAGHTGERPHNVLPDTVRRAMLAAHASAFVASSLDQELLMHEELLHIVNACCVRHVHMAGITRASFVRGIHLDFDELERLGRKLTRALDSAHSLDVESAAGTRLHVTLGTMHRWVPQFGTVAPGLSTTLPTGALYVPTESLRGTFAANASLSKFFGAGAGILVRTPVLFHIEDAIVVGVEATHSSQLQHDLEDILALSPNSNRVGLVALGINAAVDVPTGDASVDQTMMGIHLIVGDPKRAARVPWSARSAFIACSANSSISTSGIRVIEDGHFGPPSRCE
jgi:leucyl aminopeptidase (aminopeptidase T)